MLDTISVTGEGGTAGGYVAKNTTTASKTDTPVLETPQSISIVTKDQVAAQQAQTVAQAMRYTPGITIDTYGPLTFFNPLMIRGFQAQQYLDGMRLPVDPGSQFAYPQIEPYGLEQIEVLKGPSSGLYGQTNPGGLLNMVSKRPIATPHAELLGQYGSFNRVQGGFDIGGSTGKNSEFMYRLVGLGRRSDTQIDFVQDNKVFIAPSFTWRPGANTSLTILSSYQKIDNKGFQQHVPGIGTLYENPNGRIPFSRYILEPTNDRYTMEQSMVGYAFDHRFNEVFQFRQNFRATEVKNDLNALRTEGLLADLRTDVRNNYFVAARSRNLALDNQLQADFATGPLKHKVLFGLDYLNTSSHTDFRGGAAPTIDVFNPVYGVALPPTSSFAQFTLRDDRQKQLGVYVQDQIKLDRWTLSLTGRKDWASSSSTNFINGVVSSQDDSAFTGRVGLNYLFDFGLSPYANYSTSFLPTPGATAAGIPFKPTEGEGKEIGVKYQPTGTNLLFTAALFDINQKNVLTADPANPFSSVQTGAVKVRGFEFEARGNITKELEIIGGYSRIDPRVTESNDGFVGKYMVNAAIEQASLWGVYTFYTGQLAGFGIGAGVRYVGDSYGDGANTIRIPPYTLYDAMVTYDFSYLRSELKGLRLQVNATNLFDHYYVASCVTSLTYCSLGSSRTVLATLKYNWQQQ